MNLSLILEAHKAAKTSYFRQRLEGAQKAARDNRTKGGSALLSAYHFEAKLPLYRRIIECLEDGGSLRWVREEFNGSLAQVRRAMNQRRFQEVSGRLEVLGEIIIELSL